MFYKKNINFKKDDINPTELYIRGQKATLNPRQKIKADEQPKKVIKKVNPNIKNEQIIQTKEQNDQFVFSKGFKNYITDLWKSGRYSPIHLLPKKDQPSKFSKIKTEYQDRSSEYEEKRNKKLGTKSPGVKEDLLAGFDQTKAIAFTAFSHTLKPVGKMALEKVGSTMSSMTKSFGMDGMIKGMFQKIGIKIDDIKEEGKITITGNDGYEHINGHFFRCRGSKGVQDFLIFTSVGVGGKVIMTVLGLGAAGAMIANPLTAPIGCILLAMGAKKGFETLVIDSPMKLASILASLAQGIKDKNTNIKIIDEDGKLTKDGIQATQNEINAELPGLITQANNPNNLPGIETQWNNLSQNTRNQYEEMNDVYRQNIEMGRNIELNQTFETSEQKNNDLNLPNLCGISYVNMNQNAQSFHDRLTGESKKSSSDDKSRL